MRNTYTRCKFMNVKSSVFFFFFGNWPDNQQIKKVKIYLKWTINLFETCYKKENIYIYIDDYYLSLRKKRKGKEKKWNDSFIHENNEKLYSTESNIISFCCEKMLILKHPVYKHTDQPATLEHTAKSAFDDVFKIWRLRKAIEPCRNRTRIFFQHIIRSLSFDRSIYRTIACFSLLRSPP